MNEEILYKPEEIAQKLKLTKGTIYEMIKRGELQAHHIGRYIRISDTQFEAYLLKSNGYENIYEATLSHKNGETFANIGFVSICVNSKLEGNVKISIRPENIILAKGTFESSARNLLKGNVIDIINDDDSAMVVVNIGIPIKALITTKSLIEMGIEKGTELYVVFKTMSVTVYK
ncbi:excisionase family DNA-binding protein [Clostridium ljungdahlii]|uniref:Molybdate transporter ATP-binding protein n=1 Tax=Clostridium ljungdahlii TaxID=1538 RepID=A0A162KLT0_9CLOT|nr:excisionase family DNA-binding protein [Clostridium ljungdahlii]OAA83992.1 molybdate transporter ATP-binding protein [Clostridium ljungdahlii]